MYPTILKISSPLKTIISDEQRIACISKDLKEGFATVSAVGPNYFDLRYDVPQLADVTVNNQGFTEYKRYSVKVNWSEYYPGLDPNGPAQFPPDRVVPYISKNTRRDKELADSRKKFLEKFEIQVNDSVVSFSVKAGSWLSFLHDGVEICLASHGIPPFDLSPSPSEMNLWGHLRHWLQQWHKLAYESRTNYRHEIDLALKDRPFFGVPNELKVTLRDYSLAHLAYLVAEGKSPLEGFRAVKLSEKNKKDKPIHLAWSPEKGLFDDTHYVGLEEALAVTSKERRVVDTMFMEKAAGYYHGR